MPAGDAGRLVCHALSCLATRGYGCIARMMRKANRARLASGAAVLLP